MIKEAVVETIEEVESAIANGADRLELCDNLAVGGTTLVTVWSKLPQKSVKPIKLNLLL